MRKKYTIIRRLIMNKICFIAPSGYGKTTAIKLIGGFEPITNITIAKPLYDLQKSFYKFLNMDIEDKQDGELLQFLGLKIRKENPTFLLDNFKDRLKEKSGKKMIISNDDCRPPNYQCLKDLGFVFIKINGYCRTREDHTKADAKSSIEWQNVIKCDYEVDNWGTMSEYEQNLRKLLTQIKEG